jgi:hypothetical protein
MGEDSKLERCASAVWAKRESRGACILLKGCSLGAGIFLIVAGIIGLSAIAYGQIVYFIGSFYTIVFGLLVTARQRPEHDAQRVRCAALQRVQRTTAVAGCGAEGQVADGVGCLPLGRRVPQISDAAARQGCLLLGCRAAHLLHRA